MSKDFVDQKRHLIGSIINLMISTELRDSVDTDALVAFLDGDLAYLQPGAPYHLDSFADFLTDQGASEGQIRGSLLFLRSKAADLALPVRIPAYIEVLPASIKDKLLDRMKEGGANIGNGLEGLALPVHIGTGRVKASAPQNIAMIDPGGGESKGAPRRVHPLFLLLLLVSMIIGGAGLFWLQANRASPTPPVILPTGGNFLPCEVIFATGRVAVCQVNVNNFNKLTAKEKKKRGQETVAALNKLGKPTQRILVQDVASPKTLALLP